MTAQLPLDRLSSIVAANSPSPAGCKKVGVCSRIWQTSQGDYLIPFPSSNGHGCLRRELSYDTASAMQNRVLRMVKSSDEFLFCPSAARFWTPHSERTFMPSATATLGFEKSVRDFLGGWSAQASERYARIAAQRIRNMQRTVVAELQKDLVDPLAEAETLVQFDGFLSEQGAGGGT